MVSVIAAVLLRPVTLRTSLDLPAPLPAEAQAEVPAPTGAAERVS